MLTYLVINIKVVYPIDLPTPKGIQDTVGKNH